MKKLVYVFLMILFLLFAGCDSGSSDNGNNNDEKPELLSGKFSVDPGRQVQFSRGNLFWDGSTWGFEENQFDFHTWEDGKTGLFYWTKSASESYKETYGEAGTTDTDVFFANSDASVKGADWFALSHDEFLYLMMFRDDAGDKFGFATVCGMTGVVILPDLFTDPMKSHGTDAFSSMTIDNVYSSAEDWNAMETAGAVFLPTGGYRNGSSVGDVGVMGYYWLSTPYDAACAYNLFFNSSGRGMLDGDRNSGFSVRLVKEAE